jgi:tetratricopeptide (TPR) repeat protein
MRIKYFFAFIFILSCTNNERLDERDNNKEKNSFYTQQLSKRANFFYKNNKFIQAIACYDSLLLLDTTKGGYYFKRGYCKASLINIPYEAISDYKKAIELNYSEKSSAYLNLGVMYWIVLNKPDSAIYYFDECLKIDPDNQKAQFEKSAIQAELNKLH